MTTPWQLMTAKFEMSSACGTLLLLNPHLHRMLQEDISLELSCLRTANSYSSGATDTVMRTAVSQ